MGRGAQRFVLFTWYAVCDVFPGKKGMFPNNFVELIEDGDGDGDAAAPDDEVGAHSRLFLTAAGCT